MVTNHSEANVKLPIKVTLLLENLASGNIAASIFEFPQCRVEAPSRDQAIKQIKTAFLERLTKIEALPWDVSAPSPAWLKFAGVFRDDPDFRAITALLQAERNADDKAEVDPSYYL